MSKTDTSTTTKPETKKQKRTSKKGKKSKSSVEFIVGRLKANPTEEFKVTREAAAKNGITIYPISYGRAKSLLGLTKPKAKKVKTTTKKTKSGRSSKKIDVLHTDIVSGIKSLGGERDRLRKALQKVQSILSEVL